MSPREPSLFRLLPFLGGFALLVLGGLSLYLSLPHADPWRMLHIDVLYWSTPYLALRLPFSTTPFLVPMYPFLSIIGLCVLATLFLSSKGRGMLSAMGKRSLFLPMAIAWAIFFALTFTPGLKVGGISSRSVAVYLTISLLGSIFVGTGMMTILGPGEWRGKILGWMSRMYEPVRRGVFGLELKYFLGALFLLHGFLTNLVSYYCFEHLPHVQDSIAQFFHAKIFAHGNLVAVSPPLRDFFDFTHVINNGQWYSQYPPGHSVLLALGVLAGIPWIVNPLLGAGTVVLFYFLGKELYGESVGRLSAILGLLSPLILFMSSEFMNHASSLFFFTLFVLYGAKFLRTEKAIHGLVAGGAIGWVVAIRPLTAVGAALPLLLYGGAQLVRRRKQLMAGSLAMAGAASVFVGLLLLFNYLTNGHPLLFGFQVLYGEDVLPGFGNSAWGEAHTLLRGVYQTLDNLLGMNKYLFEWPIPSLMVVFLLFIAQTVNKWDFLLLGSAFSLAIAYLFYWYQDWCFGPRFLYEAACPFVILTARGLEQLPRLLRIASGTSASIRRLTALAAFVMLIVFTVGFATNIPPLLKTYGERYWGVSGRGLELVKRAGLRNAIVFTRSNYGGVFTANEPDLSHDVIFVRDRGKRNVLLMKHFDGYSFYLLEENRVEPYPPMQP